MLRVSALLLVVVLDVCHGDVYMHNPRGSNDRNCERNVNRNNGNRLFDSQNNAKGGYACPRAVGDETVQDEDGVASFGGVGDQSMRMYYYEGSLLPIEWTNQHGCGMNSKVNCEVVVQYMCEDTADPQVDNFWPWTTTKHGAANAGAQAFRSGDHIAAPRDGIPINSQDAATDTIPDTADAATPDSVGDRRYGMHESYDFYQLCQYTQRNKGLYTADQNVRRNDKRGTRQNPNGDRRGLECPEERDYYPWWHPSPWVDIAVLSNDAGDEPCSDPSECTTQRCRFYLENSFNRHTKGYCDVDHDASGASISSKVNSNQWKGRKWYDHNASCTAGGYRWYEVSLADWLNLSYPMCQRTSFARVNQLGNSFDETVDLSKDTPDGLNANRFLWTIPKVPEVRGFADDYFSGASGGGLQDAYQSCVLRVRYNISTSDFPAWPAAAMEPGHPWEHAMVDSRNNSNGVGPSPNTPLEQDPYVYIGAGDTDDTGSQFVSLAVNTNQYARTFQDRSYKFAIRPRPEAAAAEDASTDRPSVPAIPAGARVFNVNVRGKRGNIVQTYPAVEYDFVPNSLALDPGDYVHFQWTGSDYNPRRGCNDAEGGPPDPNNFISSTGDNSRADRSNVVFMDYMANNAPMDYLGYIESLGDDSSLDSNPSGLAYDEKVESMKEALVNATPCEVQSTNGECFQQVVRLAYLNQQSDGGSLSLRRGRACLTTEQLNAIANKNERENHPLNCAKLNAKPYPYFDGGVMQVQTPGHFSFFSSRNNNFSNRDQTGFVCVRGVRGEENFTCETDSATGVLQGSNFAISSGTVLGYSSRQGGVASHCIDEASSNSGANDQGATSCITAETSSILGAETFTTEQAANDAMGDGEKKPCEVISWFTEATSAVRYLVLATVLSIIGVFAFWAAVYIYNRIRARQPTQAVAKEFKNHTWVSNPDRIDKACI